LKISEKPPLCASEVRTKIFDLHLKMRARAKRAKNFEHLLENSRAKRARNFGAYA